MGDEDALRGRHRRRRSHRCPRCGSTSISGATDVGFIDSFLGLVGRRRYVCRDCHRRFVDRPLAPRGSAPAREPRRA